MSAAPSPDKPRTRPRRLSLVRSFAMADFITLANAAAGMGSILLCMAFMGSQRHVYLWWALGLLPLAFACDVADGTVARWRRRASPYGADLDSLADIVSFGVGPAVLAFALGMRGGWDALVLIYFVVCGIGRLARFNVTAAALTTETGKVSHFEGTPIPTSLLLVGVLAAALGAGATDEALWGGSWLIGPFVLHPLVLLYAASGSAMVTATLKIPKP